MQTITNVVQYSRNCKYLRIAGCARPVRSYRVRGALRKSAAPLSRDKLYMRTNIVTDFAERKSRSVVRLRIQILTLLLEAMRILYNESTMQWIDLQRSPIRKFGFGPSSCISKPVSLFYEILIFLIDEADVKGRKASFPSTFHNGKNFSSDIDEFT